MPKVLLCILILSFAIPGLASCAGLDNKVAIISLNGAIQAESGKSLFGGSAITPSEVRTQLQRAQNDTSVKAIVIQVNSPGGDVSACQEIMYEMEKVKKPVVISMRSIAASGGYYISAKATKIVALPSTLTGSIGVISEMPNLKGLLDKIGVKMEIIKSGKYKDMYSGMRELKPEEIEIMQKTTDQMYELFISVVAEGRHLDKEKVRELATGQIYTGLEAKQLGLVDELGGLQTAIDIAAKLSDIQSPRTEYYQPESTDLLKLLLGLNGNKMTDLAGSGLLGAEAITAIKYLYNAYPMFFYK